MTQNPNPKELKVCSKTAAELNSISDDREKNLKANVT